MFVVTSQSPYIIIITLSHSYNLVLATPVTFGGTTRIHIIVRIVTAAL